MRRILFTAIMVFFSSFNCYALNWQDAHKTADKLTVKEAKVKLEGNPADKEAMYVMALVYLNAYQIDSAGEIFSRLYSEDPGLFEAKWGKAEVLRRKHKIEESTGMLNEVIEQHPDFYPAYISLSYIEYTKRQYNKAIVLAKKVLAAGRDSVDLSNVVRAYLLLAGNRGMIAYNGGPISKIINGPAVIFDLRRAESMQPDAVGVLFAMGSYYLLLPAFAGRNLEKAESYLNKTIKLYPLFPDAYVRLAQLYKFKKDSARYEEYLNKALKIDPDNELALDIKSGKCNFICLDRD